jgi:hypothetical protein
VYEPIRSAFQPRTATLLALLADTTTTALSMGYSAALFSLFSRAAAPTLARLTAAVDWTGPGH